jgi:hypothetical protein
MSKPPKRSRDNAVEAVFSAYPRPVQAKLLALRRLIFNTAKATPGVGRLHETLKWGQPSYLTCETKSGSTIRIDQAKRPINTRSISMPDQAGRDISRALSGAEFRRQPLHPA